MIIRMDGQDIVRHADPDRWIDTVATLFPNGDQRGFWRFLYDIEARSWDLVRDRPYLPPVQAADFLRMMHPSNIAALPLVPGLLRPVAHVMRRYGVDADARFVRFINEQLLISTQQHATHAPYLPGALGLTYPSSTWYPVGGMYRPALLLMRSITQHGGMVKFRRAVTSIESVNGAWKVTTSNGETYQATTVVSSIPIWNMVDVTHGSVRGWMKKHAGRRDDIWSAVTMYLAVEGRPDLPTAYYQIHVDTPLPHCASDTVFVTVSRPDDGEKAPPGVSTVTVSTHARWTDWQARTKEQYDQQRRDVMKAILGVLERQLPEIGLLPRIYTGAGTPQTWITYTQRYGGYVGGIPHDVRRPMLLMTPNQTPFRGLYMIGDSVFPGQGTPAVMLGAWNTVERIVG
jgi:phytoene dehydrogenase-like protein